jgi:hypothetical protein
VLTSPLGGQISPLGKISDSDFKCLYLGSIHYKHKIVFLKLASKNNCTICTHPPTYLPRWPDWATTFRPLEVCLLWAVFFQLQKSANYWATFLHSKRDALILTKCGLGHILGDFLQTHLVTLLPTYTWMPLSMTVNSNLLCRPSPDMNHWEKFNTYSRRWCMHDVCMYCFFSCSFVHFSLVLSSSRPKISMGPCHCGRAAPRSGNLMTLCRRQRVRGRGGHWFQDCRQSTAAQNPKETLIKTALALTRNPREIIIFLDLGRI